jgi:hypothetical protein
MTKPRAVMQNHAHRRIRELADRSFGHETQVDKRN